MTAASKKNAELLGLAATVRTSGQGHGGGANGLGQVAVVTMTSKAEQ